MNNMNKIYNKENLTLEQKIGQLFVTGFPGKEPSEEFLRLVREEKVGNVILFTHNIGSMEQMSALNGRLSEIIERETGIPPFISIDEEGGVVSRLPEGIAVLPSAMAQASAGDEWLVREGARITGEELLALGVNFNLAPVLDINSNPQNPVIGVRSYGEDAETVCRYAAAAAAGYKDAGILSSGKHFPGHGNTALDSHLSLPAVEGTMQELEERELVPFRYMIERGIPALTIAHIKVLAMEKEEIPCTMSHEVVTGYLRGKLGFQGLIISDCMEMDAIKKYYGVGRGVVEGLRAGIDLIFVYHTANAVGEGIEAVKRALKDGTLTMTRLDDAVNRVLTAKEKYAGKAAGTKNVRTDEQYRFMERFLEKTVVPFGGSEEGKVFGLGDTPLFAGALPSRMTLASSKVTAGWDFAHYMQERFGGYARTFSINPSEEEIAGILLMAEQASSVVLGTLNGHLQEGQRTLIAAMNRWHRESGRGFALNALRNPYDLKLADEDVFRIPLYEYSVRTMRAAEKYYKGPHIMVTL